MFLLLAIPGFFFIVVGTPYLVWKYKNKFYSDIRFALWLLASIVIIAYNDVWSKHRPLEYNFERTVFLWLMLLGFGLLIAAMKDAIQKRKWVLLVFQLGLIVSLFSTYIVFMITSPPVVRRY